MDHSWAAIHTPLQITDVNIGLLIILGITSVGVYGVRTGGLGVEQQVLDAGQPARLGADGQLRDGAWAFRWWEC